MPLKLLFFLDGKQIKEPLNYKETSLELRYDKDAPDFQGEVSVNSWTLGLGEYNNFIDDGANIANNYINLGLGGGVGVTEGITYQIYLNSVSPSNLVYDGMLDLFSGKIMCNEVQANSIESGRIDWFNEVADSFTFEYLYELSNDPLLRGQITNTQLANHEDWKITSTDFVSVPYLLSGVPDAFKASVLALCFFAVVQDILEVVNGILEKSLELATDPLMWGLIAGIIFRVLRIIILVVTVVRLVQQLFDTLIGSIKYHEAMYVLDSCKKGAAYLGFDFKSSLIENTLYENLVILPQKYNQYEQPDDLVSSENIKAMLFGIDDFNQSKQVNLGFYKGTYGDLLRELKKVFNAKVVIKDNTIFLESVDAVTGSDLYVLPDLDRSNVPFSFNVDDFSSLYSISFVSDLKDENVWQRYLGTELKVITAQKSINNVRNVLTRNETSVDINFSRGIRKEKETRLEKVYTNFAFTLYFTLLIYQIAINIIIGSVNLLIKGIKFIIKGLNTIPGVNLGKNLKYITPVDFTSKIKESLVSRNGILLMENDFVNVPKLIMIQETNDGNRVHVANEAYVNAVTLWHNYHYKNSFVEDSDALTEEHNQYKIYELNNVPFCLNDYNKVRETNFIREADGITQAEIVSLKWNIYEQKADIKYKVKSKYTNNLKITKVLSDGR